MKITEERVDEIFEVFQAFDEDLTNYYISNNEEAKQSKLLAALLTISYFMPVE